MILSIPGVILCSVMYIGVTGIDPGQRYQPLRAVIAAAVVLDDRDLAGEAASERCIH